MCGICGIWGEHPLDQVQDMMRVLQHRGPDDSGSWCDSRVALGHRRLSIIDRSPAGHQPMSNEDGSAWIVNCLLSWGLARVVPPIHRSAPCLPPIRCTSQPDVFGSSFQRTWFGYAVASPVMKL